MTNHHRVRASGVTGSANNVSTEGNITNRKASNSRRDIVQNRDPTEETSDLSSVSQSPNSNSPVPVSNLAPSSSTAGFFQIPPKILNQFHDDIALQRALSLFLPQDVFSDLSPSLSTFGAKVLGTQIQSWVLDAERNPPYVKAFDTWGRRCDELITSTGWQSLQALGIAEGMVAIPYENMHREYSRIHHFAKYAIWCSSAAWVNCPTLMVDGVASLLRKHLSDNDLSAEQRPVLQSAYNRLTSRDPAFAWTTGQWMTERQGGSDVSMTETLATLSPSPSNPQITATDGHALGPWLLSGFKWFSSATDANMMVLLARTPNPEKPISLFFAPMRRTLSAYNVQGSNTDTELNGVRIQRLKSKLGTRALPTAELELQNVHAWLIGHEGQGTKEIATVLNIARIHNGVTAIGFWGRALGIVKAFTRVRIVGGEPLWRRASFMHSLARMQTVYRGDVLLNFFVAGLLGIVEQESIAAYQDRHIPVERASVSGLGQIPCLASLSQAQQLLRLLTPVLKGHCSKTAIKGLQECMECLGGVGYLENEDQRFNIARLYRDANVLPIWEGTTDMMAHDAILRVLYRQPGGQKALQATDQWVHDVLKTLKAAYQTEKDALSQWWTTFKYTVQTAEKGEVELKARALMEILVDVVTGLLLMVDSTRDGDTVAALVVHAWFREKMSYQGLTVDNSEEDWRQTVQSDLQIVFGPGEPEPPREPVRARI